MLIPCILRWCAWFLAQPLVGEQVASTMVIVDDQQSGFRLLTEELVDAVLVIGGEPSTESIAGCESCDEILCWFLLITKSPELWQLATDVSARQLQDIEVSGDFKVFRFEGHPFDLLGYETTLSIEDRRASKPIWESGDYC